MFPIVDPDSQIDFYAGNNRSLSLLLPLWEALGDRRGIFYANIRVKPTGGVTLQKVVKKLEGIAPLVVVSRQDLRDVYIIGEERPFVLFERDYSTEHNGLMKIVSLFLSVDERTFRYRKVINPENTYHVKDDKEAVSTLLQWVKGKTPEIITEVEDHSIGLVYMAFGEKALHAVKKSVASLQRKGYSYPVTVVGDLPSKYSTDRFNFIQWERESPFDVKQKKNFQFRAGRIKPLLWRYTPYTFNLYLDADTVFLRPVHEMFAELLHYDLIVTEEKLKLEELYNKRLAGWEINILERDTTMVEIGEASNQNFINSGVFFFRNNKRVAELFEDWHNEWMRFQEWDEQLALTRAIYNHPNVKIKRLPVQWNDPFPNHQSYIFHNYGRGTVRTNYDAP